MCRICYLIIEEKFLLSRRLWCFPACFLWEFDDKYGMIKLNCVEGTN